jgi:hypothetical protein
VPGTETHVKPWKAVANPTKQLTPLSSHWFSHQLTKHYLESCHLWSIIHHYISSTPDMTTFISLQDFISTAYILEDFICVAATSLSSIDIPSTNSFQRTVSDLVDIYSRSELHPKQIKFADRSFAQSI